MGHHAFGGRRCAFPPYAGWRELVIALKPNNVRQQGFRLVFDQLLRHLSGLWRILSKPVRKGQ